MIRISRTQRIDWTRVIANLRTSGKTLRDIAAAVDCSESVLRDWCDADRCIEPAFWTGAALLQLWADTLGVPWTDAPTRRVPESVARVLRETA